MKKALIDMTVASLEAAIKFYCEELALFDFSQDYGMGTVSLAYRANESIFLLLTERAPTLVGRPVFRIEVESCESIFNRLRAQTFESGGKLLSEEIFEYPLEKSLALQDPSGNMFLLFEER
jgi:predicted enzyme related to lactoylglutathione lyase